MVTLRIVRHELKKNCATEKMSKYLIIGPLHLVLFYKPQREGCSCCTVFLFGSGLGFYFVTIYQTSVKLHRWVHSPFVMWQCVMYNTGPLSAKVKVMFLPPDLLDGRVGRHLMDGDSLCLCNCIKYAMVFPSPVACLHFAQLLCEHIIQ